MVLGCGDRLEKERGNDPCSVISIANQGYAGQAESVFVVIIPENLPVVAEWFSCTG
jgi:hypothetical protein